MNKIKLSLYICSALSVITHTLNLYAKDISLFSIPIEQIGDTHKNIADLSIPTINKRDIPIHLFPITSSSIPKTTHTLDRSKKSISALSEWQIDMNSLPMPQMTTASTSNSCTATSEKLMQDFPEMKNSFPHLMRSRNTEIYLNQKQIDPLYYLIQYTPFSPVEIRNRCSPNIECFPVPIDKKESEKSVPELSSVLPFLMRTSTFSMQGDLPPSEVPALSYGIFDGHMTQDSICFPTVASPIDSLQEVILTHHLYIEPKPSTPVANWYPQSQLAIFSKDMEINPEIILPIIHTAISKYIPSKLENISMIKLQVNRPMTFIGPFHYMENFALLPNLQDLRTISYRDEFSSTTSAMPSDTGEYYFSITLTPNQHLAFPAIPQTVFFLIDRSSHITAEQFNSFQRGVIRALSYIPNNSRFNIAFFDQKISFLHPTDLEIGSDAIHRAGAFVRSASKRVLFGASDIYSALHAIQSEVPSVAHTSYILLTSKKSLQSGKNSELLSNFIRDHRETCTLYIASIGDDIINIPNIEESLYSDTHATFPRRLATLVKNLSFPIANHLKISAITDDPNLHIELFPNSHIIHQDKPFIIYGKMDHLKNFQLILQGNNLSSWINITKPITFNVPCHSTKSLAKHFNKPEKSRL